MKCTFYMIKYSHEIRVKVVKEIENGDTIRGTARKYGISKNVVRRWYRRRQKKCHLIRRWHLLTKSLSGNNKVGTRHSLNLGLLSILSTSHKKIKSEQLQLLF